LLCGKSLISSYLREVIMDSVLVEQILATIQSAAATLAVFLQ